MNKSPMFHGRWLLPAAVLALQFALAGLAWATPDWVNVKNFGAVGDGVTDDAPAVQSAINSMTNGGTLYFPAGKYLLDSTVNSGNQVNQNYALLITNSITMEGDGTESSVLIQGWYQTTMIVGQYSTPQAGLTLDNLKLLGDETSTSGYSATPDGVLLCCIGSGHPGAWTKGFRVHNVAMDDQGKNFMIWMTNVDDVHIEHCRFTSYSNTNNLANAGSGALHALIFAGTYRASGAVHVEDNYFDSDANSAGGNSQGERGGLNVQSADAAVITGNYMANFTDQAIECGALQQTISGNVFETGKSNGPVAIQINPTTYSTNYQAVIANNVQAGGDSFLNTAYLTGVSVDFTIVKNTVKLGNKAQGICGASGILFNNNLACRTVIKDNSLDNYGVYGIGISGIGTYDSSAVIQGNSLTSMNTNVIGAQCAMTIGGFQNISVLNNTLSGGGNGQLVVYGPLTATTNVVGQLVVANNLLLNSTNQEAAWFRVQDATGGGVPINVGAGAAGITNVSGLHVNYSLLQ